jgi:hypothetical protein
MVRNPSSQCNICKDPLSLVSLVSSSPQWYFRRSGSLSEEAQLHGTCMKKIEALGRLIIKGL